MIRLTRWTKQLPMIAALLLGLVLGMVLVNVWVGKQLEGKALKISELSQELNEQEKTIEQLRENVAASRQMKVKTIKLQVSMEQTPFTEGEEEYFRLRIGEKIKPLLEELRGETISDLNGRLIINVIQGRTVTVDEREFTLQVLLLVISDTLEMHVVAHRR